MLHEGLQLDERTGEQALGQHSGTELRDLLPSNPQYGNVSAVVIAQVDADNRTARSDLEVGNIFLAAVKVPVSSNGKLPSSRERCL